MTTPNPATVVGLGATEFSKNSGRSELRLALEAITAALSDAGLTPEDVDGFVTFDFDNNDPMAVARNLGVTSSTFFARSSLGGGSGCASLGLAKYAVETGKAKVVVCYRAMNERSEWRFGQPSRQAKGGLQTRLASTLYTDGSWFAPYGMATDASRIAPAARRYLHEYNATTDAFGQVAVNQRTYAQTNPKAYFFGRPMTIDDYHNSRMIADPLRLFDCCQESDGSIAFVVTTRDRARDLKQKPVQILATAQGMGSNPVGLASPYAETMTEAVETRIVGDQLWDATGLKPADMDVASLYDHFTCAVLIQLEALGFCGAGEAPELLSEGGLAIDGLIPTNTSGGQLSEAYIHGYEGIAELVRQMRGTAANQVPNAKFGVATGGSKIPTSGLVLAAD